MSLYTVRFSVPAYVVVEVHADTPEDAKIAARGLASDHLAELEDGEPVAVYAHLLDTPADLVEEIG